MKKPTEVDAQALRRKYATDGVIILSFKEKEDKTEGSCWGKTTTINNKMQKALKALLTAINGSRENG